MTKEIAITNQQVGIVNLPEETLEMASLASKALQRVISQKTKPVIMGGEQYLEFEDLQLLGQFYGVAVKTHDAVPVEVYGVKGAKAQADLIVLRTGEIIGGAEAYCMRDEPKWNMRTKYEWQDGPSGREKVAIGEEAVPWFQLASMAQTRAGAKALRNRLAWVVVLAGYRPTPAEELTGDEVVPTQKPASGHFCKQHKVGFFKSGKMKSYAHPVKDANGQEIKDEQGKTVWCHEHTEIPPEVAQGDAIQTTDGEPMPSEALLKLVFMNPGQFYTACLKFFKLDKSAVDKEVSMYDLNTPDQRKKAWEIMVNARKEA